MLCALTLKAALSGVRVFTASHNTVYGWTMGWWMLLLLHLHLGNAPWIEVVCVSLPAPSNISISSFNMEHTLSFLPGLQTPSDTLFTVQILCPRKKKNPWKTVAACSKLTARQTCNLTRAFKDPFDHYQARVQAFTPTQTSSWTVSGWFQPLSDTVLGPPDVSVSGCGNCLLLQFKAPPTAGLQQVRDLYRGLIIDVQRTRDRAQFKLSLPYKEEHMITYLQPGVEYCVNVSVTSFFSSSHVSSKPHCAFTSPPMPRSSLYMVFILLAAFCALGFLLIGLVVYSGRRLLRQRLTRPLSYIVLQCQSRGDEPIELSAQISAAQRHKEGSAVCLLPAHRPVHSLSGERTTVDCE